MRLAVLLMTVLLAGCASGQILNRSLGSGAEIAIFRPSEFVGSAVTATITINGSPVAKLGSCEWFVAAVVPGEHLIRADSSGSTIVEASPSSPVFVMVDPNMTEMFGGGWYVLKVPGEMARPHLTGCKQLR